PWGLEDQPWFYNLVAELSTSLPPHELLRHVLSVEASLGRQRTVRWGPRTVDIDVLLYDSLALDTPELTVPHPRILRRAFVLVPLAELAPEFVVGGRTVREHLRALGDVSGEVRLLGPLPGWPAGTSMPRG
ncbi:MAG: 2-amino-4-hydroxy-6-hydroxymethyldihydropteridine diphosphokinase, partial [Bacillota bacterium]